jgi:predicted dehydrogenase
MVRDRERAGQLARQLGASQGYDRVDALLADPGEPLASGMDGLRNTEAIATAYQAGREGRVLDLPL